MTTLRARIERLERRVRQHGALLRPMQRALDETSDRAVRVALRRRGWRWRRVRHDACLLPADPAHRAAFSRLLRRYSFRLFLRDVVGHGDDFAVSDLVRYCSAAVARRYLAALVDARLVRRRRGGRYRLVPADVRSFGATLEWLVATVLAEEFGVPCVWNVRLERGGEGGDYDVIALLEGELLYVETKSSPPRNIEVRQANAFCRRVATLQPDLAVFLNDTQLHMRPKVLPLLRRAYRDQFGACRVEQLAAEVYLLGDIIYVMNSDPDLVTNLERCLAHHLSVRRRGRR